MTTQRAWMIILTPEEKWQMNDPGTKLKEALVDFDIEGIVPLAKEALRAGEDPLVLIKNLTEGIQFIGEQFERGELFLSQMVMAAETMKAALEILEPAISNDHYRKSEGKVVIGTVEGDIHDIGKNLVKMILVTNGFEVEDLGVDVPVKVFVEKVREAKPDILAISALLTTTMDQIAEIITALKAAELRDNVKIIVGGAPIKPEWAKEFGADGYAPDMVTTVAVCRDLLVQT